MKRLLALLFIVILSACSSGSTTEAEKTSTEMEDTNKPENIVGGWSDSEINQEVKDAASFALTELGAESEIDEILEAKTQIVSGRNYDITLTLTNGEKWNFVVYKNLQNEYSLTTSEQL